MQEMQLKPAAALLSLAYRLESIERERSCLFNTFEYQNAV